MILEPVRKREWPEGYWTFVDEQRANLELGDIEPLGGILLDVSIDNA